MKKTAKHLLALLLVFVLLSSFAACAPNNGGLGILDSIPELDGSVLEESSEAVSTDPEPAEGQARMPVITEVNNITADTVLVAGTCEEGLTVRISGGTEDVEVKSLNGTFITAVSFTSVTTALLEAVAFSDDKTTSETRSFSAIYDATAEKRIDGYSVSAGSDSYLVFDSAIDDYRGAKLMTQTELKAFKAFIETKIKNLTNRAGDYPVSLIYVLIPDATTIYPERLPAGTTSETFKTRYEQVSETLKSTKAVCLDMKPIFLAAKESGSEALYGTTDSHLTDYGSYLVYKAICDVLDDLFPDAAARDLNTEFTKSEASLQGGDLAYYAGLDVKTVLEHTTLYTPKFSFKIGNGTGSTGVNIADLPVYQNENSLMFGSGAKTAAQRVIFRTNRDNLPCAIIYRDESALPMYDILAERFDTLLYGVIGDFTINMTDAQRYASGAKTTVDYIINIVSESNITAIAG